MVTLFPLDIEAKNREKKSKCVLEPGDEIKLTRFLVMFLGYVNLIDVVGKYCKY